MSYRNIRGGTVNINMYVFSGNVVDVAILDQPQEDRTIRANTMKGATTAISSSRGGGAIRVALCLHVVGVARGGKGEHCGDGAAQRMVPPQHLQQACLPPFLSPISEIKIVCSVLLLLRFLHVTLPCSVP
jgi:hypothetical protein